MAQRQTRRRFVMLAAPLAVLLAVIAIGGGLARRAAAHEGDAHPIHIHAGTCDDLGDVVQPLSPLSQGTDLQGTPVADDAEAMGAGSAIAVDISVTRVDLPLDEIVAADHAINAHLSDEEIQTYIACGDIGGTMLGDSLVIGLAEVENSGFSGVAVLTAAGQETEVTVYLTEQAAGADEGAEDDEAAAGGGDAAAAEGAAVAIEGFAYNPESLTVPAGTTVTWTNNDSAPHTATGEGQVFQSGTLNQGDTFEQTFDEAGEYSYYCEFHAGMTGTITVE